MRRLVVACLAVLATIASCTPQQAKSVADLALTVAEVGCIFESEVTDSAALAEACRIDAKLAPLIRQLIGEREAAKKAGVRWTPVDGGS